MSEFPSCRHCRVKPANRRLGLCYSCYYRPGIREEYSTTSKYGRRGHACGMNRDKQPTEPTSHPPGTPCKELVMAGRAMRGEVLFHPGDAERDD